MTDISPINNDGNGVAETDIRSKLNEVIAAVNAGSSAAGAIVIKGSTDCSTNPNYAAAVAGDAYIVSVAGKIGGAAGEVVGVGDLIVAAADNAGGTEAAVGASWFVLEHNILALGTAAFLNSDTDGTLAANSDSRLATQKAVVTYIAAQIAAAIAALGLGTGSTLTTDTDVTLAANSDARVATQKAVKAYVDASGGGGGALGLTSLNFPGCNMFVADPLPGGYFVGRAFIAPKTGTITHIGGLVAAASAGANVKPGVYDSNAATLELAGSALLAQGATVVGVTIGMNLLPLAAPLAVVEGDTYWIGWELVSGAASMMQLLNGVNTRYFNAGGGALPDPAPASTAGATQASFFAVMA